MDHKKIIEVGEAQSSTAHLQNLAASYWRFAISRPTQVKPDILPDEWVKFEQVCDEAKIPCYRQEGGHFIIAESYYALAVYLHNHGLAKDSSF